MSPKVDAYLSKLKKWRPEIEQLRRIVLDCPLTEEIKWGKPCYTFQNGNVVLINAFKGYCALLFFKGALLKDSQGILVRPGENTQAGRQIRFTSLAEIKEPILKAYLGEAIELEKAGLEVSFKKPGEFVIPEDIQHGLDKTPALRRAFNALTPGRQRAYVLYFSAAKHAKTRESRIEQCQPRILKGKGLNDCICGLTHRPPNCDGSHKQLQGASSH